jgi:hypothetical protein
LDIAQACFYSCVGLGASVWLLAYPTTPTFYLSSAHFLTTLHTCLGLPHPIVANLSWCQCGHTIDNLDTHLFWCPCGSDHITTHNTLWILLQLLFWRVEHMFRGRSFTFSLTTSNDEWIFLLPKMTFILLWTLSLLIWLA